MAGPYALDPEFVVCCDEPWGCTPQFPPIGPGDERVLTFDFTKDLVDGETLDGTPTVVIVPTSGADANADDVLDGAPAYNAATEYPLPAQAAGTQVQQPVTGADAVPGNVYFLTATAPTTNPQKILTRVALLPIRSQ